MTKQLKLQSIKMEQEGLKYRSYPESKKLWGRKGVVAWKGMGGGNVQLEVNDAM